MIQIKAPASWRSWIEVELRLKRKWSDGSESLIFSQSDFVERLAGVIPPPWFNLTRFHGVFAPNHAWRDFVVPGPTKKRTCPAHDEPNDSDPPPTGKPSAGRAPGEYWLPWAELLRKTVGVDPEICVCGARMIVDDAITDGEKIAEILARLGRRFARFNGSAKEATINRRTRLCI